MKAAFSVLALLALLGAPVSEAIECLTTTTSANNDLRALFSTFGSRAFPETEDVYNNPAPSAYSVCIKYKVFGGLVVTSADRVVYTTLVEGYDGQGVLGVQCDDLVNSTDRTLTRTGMMYSTFRYRPASISEFECCTSDNCNEGLSMLFTTYLAANNVISSGILIIFSSLLAFIAAGLF